MKFLFTYIIHYVINLALQSTSSEVRGHSKKVSTAFGSTITGGDCSSTTLETGSYIHKYLIKCHLFLMYVGDRVNDQIKLTTFKKLEESVIDGDSVVVVNKESVKDDNEEERKAITEEDGAVIVAESS